MTNYGKLDGNGNLDRLRRIPGVCNATPDRLAAYAAANGYIALEDTPTPGQYYTPTPWRVVDGKITRSWEPMELEQVKFMALERVQGELDMELKQRAAIECPGLGKSIVYDEAALLNALGLEAGDAFITATDEVLTLTAAHVDAIKAALKSYRAGLYAAATEKRAAINAAASVDDIAALGY